MAQQRYQVIERIDAGGMAEVFKANSTSIQGFQKLVAIKRVLPNLTKNERFVRMFLDEAKVSLHLNHTNIVQVFDLGMADGTYFIVMEFVDGTNLKKIIQELGKRKRRLSVEQTTYIGLEVCKGLSHAHYKKDQEGNPLSIVHRDISPPNVLISREGEVKITDFGLAKAKSQAEITDPGVVKGKFGYLSPEAADGEDVDPRTDIFALGILMWEMLAGRRLFLGESDYETLKQVRDAEIPPLSKYGRDVPTPLERIVRRALAKDPGQRYQKAEELGRELAEFMFEYGAVVTGYDISALVDEVIEPPQERKATAADVAAGQQVQRELNQLVSLEEMGNLDLFLAETYGEIASEESVSAEHDADSEDPREWMDLGFSGKEEGVPVPDESPPPGGAEDSWQEGGLDDVARATQSMQAVDGPEGERAAEQAKKRAKQKQDGPNPSKGSAKRSAPPTGGGGKARQRPKAGGKSGGPAPPPAKQEAQNAPQSPAGPNNSQPQAGTSGASVERLPQSGQTQPARKTDDVESDEESSGNALLIVLALILVTVVAAGVWLATQLL